MRHREDDVVARSPSAPSVTHPSSARGSSTSLAGSAAAGASSADGGPADGSTTPKSNGAAVAAAAAPAPPAAAGEAGGGDALSRKRAYKEKWQEGVALFNKKPKKGISMLQVGALSVMAASPKASLCCITTIQHSKTLMKWPPCAPHCFVHVKMVLFARQKERLAADTGNSSARPATCTMHYTVPYLDF